MNDRSGDEPANELARLDADVEARAQAVRSATGSWRCQRGCAACCRSLADMPRLTPPEWERLREALRALPPDQLGDIEQRIVALGAAPARPVVCPMLDRDSGACLVYAARPVACRTYGFYARRGEGMYCTDIATDVANGALSEVVWGNHAAVERRLATLGPERTLDAWYAEWRGR